MAHEQYIEERNDAQTPAAEPVAYQAALANVMSALGARMPGMQRLAQIMVAEAGSNDARIAHAIRVLGSGSPLALQHACGALRGLPGLAATAERACLH